MANGSRAFEMRDEAVGLAVGPSRFHQLAQDLFAEHGQEIAALRSEIGILRTALDVCQQGRKTTDDANGTGQAHRGESSFRLASKVTNVSSLTSDGLWPTDMGTNTMVPQHMNTAELLSTLANEKLWTCCVPRKLEDCFFNCMVRVFSMEEPERVGTLASICQSSWFTSVCASVIALNAIVTAVEVNFEMEQALTLDGKVKSVQAPLPLKVLEACFTLFYVVELVLNLSVHRMFFFINRNWRWNVFDFALVIAALVDMRFAFATEGNDANQNNFSFLRVMKVCKVGRVFRVIRMIEFVARLRLMFERVLQSFSQLVECLLMIIFTLYLFALVFMQLLASHVQEHWESVDDTFCSKIALVFGQVWTSMISLFQAVTGGADWQEHWQLVSQTGLLLEIVYLFFISFFVVVAWNIVTSSFVEEAFSLVVPGLDGLISDKHRKDAQLAKEMTRILKVYMDLDQDGLITVQEFFKHVEDPRVLDVFAVTGLDVKDARTFFQMLLSMSDNDEKTDRVDVNTFVGCAIRLQGLASSLDLQTVHFNVKRMYRKITDRLKRIEVLMNNLPAPSVHPNGYTSHTTTPSTNVAGMLTLVVDDDMRPEFGSILSRTK